MIDYGSDYPDPMAPDGAALLDDLHEWITSYVAFPSTHVAVATTLWAAHTYLVSRFESTPRLVLISPEPGCGKTRVLELLELVTTGGWLMVGPSAAALYRRVEMAHHGETPKPVTLLLDEADTVWRSGRGADESAEAIRMVVNSGHRRRASVPRVEIGGGSSIRVRDFRTYAPAAVACKGDHLPDTIMSRAVVIHMRRRSPDETVRQYRERITRPEGQELQMRMADWALSVWERVGCDDCQWPDMPAGVTDRQADVWEPLLTVADLAGGKWPELAREACAAIVLGTRDDRVSVGIRLLHDLYAVFGGANAMFTESILAGLHRIDESPWGDWYGRRFTARDLARMLKPYGIESRQVRIGEITRKGYAREYLIDAWRRYGVSGTQETRETSLASTVSHVPDVPARGAASETPEFACSVCNEPLDAVHADSGTHPSCDPEGGQP